MYIYLKVLRFYMRRWSKLDYSWEYSRERQFLHELMDVIAKVDTHVARGRCRARLYFFFEVCFHSTLCSAFSFNLALVSIFHLSPLKGGLGRIRRPLLQLRQRHGLGGVAFEASKTSQSKCVRGRHLRNGDALRFILSRPY